MKNFIELLLFLRKLLIINNMVLGVGTPNKFQWVLEYPDASLRGAYDFYIMFPW